MLEFKDKKIRAFGYTRYVSMPLEWLKTKKLNKGDKVRIWLNESGNIEIAPLPPAKIEAVHASTPEGAPACQT